MSMDDFQAPPGYRWVVCKCFKHWRSGELVYRKDGGYFRLIGIATDDDAARIEPEFHKITDSFALLP